jgi:hypothetical protein
MEVRPSFDNPFQRQAVQGSNREPGLSEGVSANAKDRLSQSMASKVKGLQGKGLNAKGMAGLIKMGGIGAGGAELSNINQQVASLSESLMGQTGSFVGSLQSSLNTTLTSLGNASTSLSEANDRLNRLLDMEGVMGQIPPQPQNAKINRERRQEIEQLDDTTSSSGDTPSAAGQAGTKAAGSKAYGAKGMAGVMPMAKASGENNNNALNGQNAGAAQMANQMAFAQQARFMSGGLNFKA